MYWPRTRRHTPPNDGGGDADDGGGDPALPLDVETHPDARRHEWRVGMSASYDCFRPCDRASEVRGIL